MIRVVLISVGMLVGLWILLVVLAARLPNGLLKELASFVPDCVSAARCLGRDPRVPRSAKLVIGLAGLWLLSPIDLVPDFLPVVGVLDDAVVIALALRYAARRIPRTVVVDAWPGRPDLIERLLGRGPEDQPKEAIDTNGS